MRYLVLLIMFLLTILVQSAPAAVIRLRSEARLSGTLIVLGDVADISEAAPEQVESLSRLTIGPAPAEGKSVRITLDAIRRELALRGVNQADLQFVGPSEITVQRSAGVTPAVHPVDVSSRLAQQFENELTHIVQQYLKQVAPELTGPRIEIPRVVSAEILRTSRGATQWQVRGGQSPWTGAQQFVLRGRNPAGEPVEAELSCTISLPPRVLALQQGLPRGQVIRDVDLVWVNCHQTEGHFTNPAEVIGTETTRSLRSESPLTREDIRQLPLIRRSDVVTVTVQIGGVRVRRYCRSLDEGTYGQLVTLMPVDGKQKLTARVSGLREAVIDVATAPPRSEPQQPGLILSATETTLSTPQPTLTPHPVRRAAPTDTRVNHTTTPEHVLQSPAPPAGSPDHSSVPGRILANQPARLTP